MIPLAYITEWQQVAPWRDPIMVEQDLIISRVLLDLFRQNELRAAIGLPRGHRAVQALSGARSAVFQKILTWCKSLPAQSKRPCT